MNTTYIQHEYNIKSGAKSKYGRKHDIDNINNKMGYLINYERHVNLKALLS